jgi:hypothetical protein
MVGRIGKTLWLEGKACRLAMDATATATDPFQLFDASTVIEASCQ